MSRIVKLTSSIEMAFALAILLVGIILAFNILFSSPYEINTYSSSSPVFEKYYTVSCNLPFCLIKTSLQFNDSNCFTYNKLAFINSSGIYRISFSPFLIPFSDIYNSSSLVHNSYVWISYGDNGLTINFTESPVSIGVLNSTYLLYNISYVFDYSPVLAVLPSYKNEVIFYNLSSSLFNLTNSFSYYYASHSNGIISTGVVLNETLPYLCIYDSEVMCFIGYGRYVFYNDSYDLYVRYEPSFSDTALYVVYQNVSVNQDAVIKKDKDVVKWM